MQCPACKAAIDDDSFFCDQCCIELLRCSQCGRIGKGKRCPLDGAAMQPLSSSSGAALAASVLPAAPASGLAFSANPAPVAVEAAVAAVPLGRILRLRNRELGIDLVPSSGDTLGRRFGQHVEVLSRFVQISSSHLELRCDAQGNWFARDMNSFNHSYYNGCMLVAGEEQRLEQGATLALADIVLAVELE